MSQRLFSTEPSQPPVRAGDSHKAALLLHALGEGDRAWLLGQLPLPQQQQLQTLLDELEMLHIPVDREFVRQVMAASAAGASQSKSVTDDALENADPRALAQVLNAEPVELVASLIAMRTWPWKERVLAELKDAKRSMVLARLRQTSASAESRPARPIDRQLMDLLAERLALTPPAASPLERGSLASMRPWWRRLLRRDRPVEVVR
ncbi:hypothetical protein ACSFBX_27485 [Variovorax sp. RB2P76]|uniref:hypothetical protein n=1 Tax=Variovorax sp. RB2P76 TaxID=3443736 RepID=UPI003F45DF87